MRQRPHPDYLRATYILCAILACANLVLDPSMLWGEDNVGRFPSLEEETTSVELEMTPAELPQPAGDQVEHADAVYPLPPPTPTFTSFGNRVPFESFAGGEFPDHNSIASGKSSPSIPRFLPFQNDAWCFGQLGLHTDPDDPARHIGIGEPLAGTSWLNRPHYSALLVGSMIADDLRSNVELHNDLFVGLHQGWDFDHYYGVEFRLAGGSYDVFDSPNEATDDMLFVDAHLLHYPWGDARWRPYYSVGIGLASHHARIGPDEVYDEMLIHFPLGIGLKYQWMRHCAMRFDIKHNISFSGGGMHGMDHVSLSCGLEYRYGGRPKSYFPWSPSIHLD